MAKKQEAEKRKGDFLVKEIIRLENIIKLQKCELKARREEMMIRKKSEIDFLDFIKPDELLDSSYNEDDLAWIRDRINDRLNNELKQEPKD